MATKMIVSGLLVASALVSAMFGCSATSSGDGNCTTLSTCCSQLSGTAATTCTYAVQKQDVGSCATLQDEFEGAKQCVVVAPVTASSTGCAGLTTCCASMTGASAVGCQGLASSGDDSTCTGALMEYVAAHACVGPITSTGPTDGTGCAGLSACCSSLPAGENTACAEVASAGNETTCTSELSGFQASNLCGGTPAGTGPGSSGTACASLSTCCTALSSTESPGCDAVVSEAVDTSCTAALQSYEAAGMCGGSGTGPGTSVDAGSGGCSDLGSCCSTLASELQVGCNEVVSGGDDAECSQDLTAYKEEGYCN